MSTSSKIDRNERERLLTLAQRNLARMSDEEDRAITRQAEGDPDSGWMSDEEFATARRGRPPLANPKKALNVRLDADVLERLKADGPGWQTRMNALLRSALHLDDAA